MRLSDDRRRSAAVQAIAAVHYLHNGLRVFLGRAVDDPEFTLYAALELPQDRIGCGAGGEHLVSPGVDSIRQAGDGAGEPPPGLFGRLIHYRLKHSVLPLYPRLKLVNPEG